MYLKLTDGLAMQPAGLPTLPTACPYTYQTVENDTYCIIATKTGVAVSLWESNYTIQSSLIMWHILRAPPAIPSHVQNPKT